MQCRLIPSACRFPTLHSLTRRGALWEFRGTPKLRVWTGQFRTTNVLSGNKSSSGNQVFACHLEAINRSLWPSRWILCHLCQRKKGVVEKERCINEAYYCILLKCAVGPHQGDSQLAVSRLNSVRHMVGKSLSHLAASELALPYSVETVEYSDCC